MNQKEIDRKVVGENLRLAIVSSNITYEQLSDMLGFNSPRVIYEWVNGNKCPSVHTLIKLKTILKISIDEVLTEK